MPRFLPLSFRRSAAAPLAALALAAFLAPGIARAQSDQQQLVDRATLSVQDLMSGSESALGSLRKARAVMICPRVFRAGFFFGGEGGGCVLAARDASGSWSYPAFYNMGSGSFGLQIGIADSQLMMLIMTEKGLNAVLDSQIKLGANAGIAVATLGAGIQGSTTTAVGADIVAFAASRGLFGGIALEGSVMSADTGWNRAYFGQPFAARQIVMQMQGSNPGADPIRDLLTRYGSEAPQRSFAPPQQQPGYAPAYPPRDQGNPSPGYNAPQPQGYAPPAQPAYPQQQYAPQYAPQAQGYANPPSGGDRGPIQQQSLAPPR